MVQVMESLCKVCSDTNLHMIHMKEAWHYEDDDLVDTHGVITNYGLTKYCQSVNLAFKFNACTHENFLARSLTQKEQEQDIDRRI